MIAPDVLHLLNHLHRGGEYSYWWRLEGEQSTWWHVRTPSDLPGQRDVYFGIHPVEAIPETNKDGKRVTSNNARSRTALITAINCLFAEYDAKDFQGSKETAKAHVDSLEPAPSVVIDSGHGYHTYWLLDTPFIIETEADRERARKLEAAWVTLVGGDKSAKDLARVLRVPGTVNAKEQPHMPVEFVRWTLDRTYSIDELDGYARYIQDDEPKRVRPSEIPITTDHDVYREWALNTITRAIASVTQAQPGEKHAVRLRMARLVGGLIPHGLADADSLLAALYAANVPKASGKQGEVQTIRDGITYGSKAPLPLPPLPRQPYIDADQEAHCDVHTDQPLSKSKYSGWYCSAPDDSTESGYCTFKWKGEGYTPPPETGPYGLKIGTKNKAQSPGERAVATSAALTPPPKAAQRPPEPSCKPLPVYAQIDPALAAAASPWLDAYVAYSREWSPLGYDGFHEACGLWLLSTIAARRVAAPVSGMKYSSLYIALAARTSVWAKSTTADLALDLLRRVGADYLLAPEECTPQSLIQQMAGKVPQRYDEFDAARQERTRASLGFAGQRGWWYDEFGQKLSGMMREGGSMQDFRGFLRKIDVSPESYISTTIGRGADEIDRPYLSLLASLTPADLAPYAQQGSALWNDGFFARFAFVAPPAETKPRLQAAFPQGERIPPAALVMTLAQWHTRLGMPEVTMSERIKGGKATGEYTAEITPAPVQACTMAPEARSAYEAYFRSMRDLVINGARGEDLDGSYTRFPEKALRVAMLLASLENNGVIEIRHWARGQQIAEQWRANLHNLTDQLSSQRTASKAAILEDKIVQKVLHLGGATVNQLVHNIRGVSTDEAIKVVEALVTSGALSVTKTSKGTKRYYVPEGEELDRNNQGQTGQTGQGTTTQYVTDYTQAGHIEAVSPMSLVTDVTDCTAVTPLADSPPPDVLPDMRQLRERFEVFLNAGQWEAARGVITHLPANLHAVFEKEIVLAQEDALQPAEPPIAPQQSGYTDPLQKPGAICQPWRHASRGIADRLNALNAKGD